MCKLRHPGRDSGAGHHTDMHPFRNRPGRRHERRRSKPEANRLDHRRFPSIHASVLGDALFSHQREATRDFWRDGSVSARLVYSLWGIADR